MIYNPFDIFKRFRYTYKNYLSVLFKVLMGSDKIHVVSRNKKLFNSSSILLPRAIAIGLAHNPFNLKTSEIEVDWKRELIKFKYNGKKITLYGSITNGDFVNTFIKGEYGWLKPENAIVIDIGANIGDTAIFFSINNAKYVYAFEPYPYSYKLMEKNIEQNHLRNITTFNSACGKHGNVIIDPDYKNIEKDDLKEVSNGYSIKVYSLADIIDVVKKDTNFNSDIILKCDCEGCEYDLILSAPSDALLMFSRIEIEYHYGYVNLKNKLEGLNFKVQYSNPVRNVNFYHNIKVGELGMIYATKE